ncbi:general substrate transporter [Dactylonectria macrodidyma]|uniref:General substrate transporter n=1 Tax=Dactylonectria macrodidyma TaxID=307937 RepID=A0A9P9DZ82_9HYPO|nr:general substrate transporter [Dactylonectria macrodidyma]
MPSIRQFVVYGMIFSSATTIGYDSGYLNGVLGSEDFIRCYGVNEDGGSSIYLTPYTRSIFSSILVVGTVVGCLLNPFVTGKIGRRGSLLVASIAYAIGVILQTIGLPPAAFVVGRILLGTALGFISNAVPAYLMECSTATNRGMLMALYLQFLTTGNVIACGINYGTSKYADSRGWRITIGFQLLLAVMIFFGSIICPESPFVLVGRNKTIEARQAIGILKNLDPESQEVTKAMEEIQESQDEARTHGNVQVMECFQGTNLRRTLLGIAMSFFTIATGITFWFGYGTTFFIAAGVKNSYMISLILAVVNCVFTAPSIYLIERIGRRGCLLWGGAIMSLTQILTGVIHSVAPNSNANKNMLVAGAIIFIAAYAPTWGIGGWVVMTESFSNRMRVYQTAVVMTSYWTVTWLVGFITPYLVDKTAGDLGVNVGYIWFGIGVLSLIWAYLCVPELAGLSTFEAILDLLFENRVPAWRSVAWQKELRTLDSVEMSRSEEMMPSVTCKKVGDGEKA